jgi:hypothetical protein
MSEFAWSLDWIAMAFPNQDKMPRWPAAAGVLLLSSYRAIYPATGLSRTGRVVRTMVHGGALRPGPKEPSD